MEETRQEPDTRLVKVEEEEACEQIIPEKSKSNYDATYQKFVEWKKRNSVEDSSEDAMLAYYNELSEKYAPSSLWSFFSMLKTTIMLYENVNIQEYSRLKNLLKENFKSYQSKQSKVFTADETDKFLSEAPDDVYLATKVATICRVWGACRADELVKMKIEDIKEQGELLVVNIPGNNTKKARRFVITEEYAPIVKKYITLRPKNVDTNRFFLNYKNGKCTSQVIGKNTFATMPQQIARYFNIADAKNYTGRGLRRTSATVLADSKVNITSLKRHGEWESSTVSEGYIEESSQSRIKIGRIYSESVTSSVDKPQEVIHFAEQPGKSRTILDGINIDISNTNNQNSNAEIISSKTQIIFNNCSITTLNYNIQE